MTPSRTSCELRLGSPNDVTRSRPTSVDVTEADTQAERIQLGWAIQAMIGLARDSGKWGTRPLWSAACNPRITDGHPLGVGHSGSDKRSFPHPFVLCHHWKAPGDRSSYNRSADAAIVTFGHSQSIIAAAFSLAAKAIGSNSQFPSRMSP